MLVVAESCSRVPWAVRMPLRSWEVHRWGMLVTLLVVGVNCEVRESSLGTILWTVSVGCPQWAQWEARTRPDDGSSESSKVTVYHTSVSECTVRAQRDRNPPLHALPPRLARTSFSHGPPGCPLPLRLGNFNPVLPKHRRGWLPLLGHSSGRDGSRGRRSCRDGGGDGGRGGACDTARFGHGVVCFGRGGRGGGVPTCERGGGGRRGRGCAGGSSESERELERR
jgi:hypothetical protein